MKPWSPTVSKLAAALVALLSFGPLATGLGLALDMLPDQFPAIRSFRAAPPIGHALWVGSGLIGVLSAVLLLRRPVLAAVCCAVFAAIYVPAAVTVWLQFTFGCWLAIAAAILAAAGAWIAGKARRSVQTDGHSDAAGQARLQGDGTP